MLKQKTAAQALTALAARITLLTAGKARLYQDDGFVPDENSTLADLNAHEANYTGYAAGGVALAAPVGPWQSGEREWSDQFGTIQFQPTAPVVTSNEIRGAYFEDSVAALSEVWIFDDPITMADALDAVFVVPKFSENADPVTAPD